MVDDSSLYSKRLIEGFRRLGVRCSLYGPTRSPPSKAPGVMETPEPDMVRVWSEHRFPLQLFKRAAKTRPHVMHFQFEFYGIHSYGRLYSSLGLPVALLLLRLLRVKSVVTLHMVIPRDQNLTLIRDTAPEAVRVPTVLLASFLLGWYKAVSILSSALIVHADVFRKRLQNHYKVTPSKTTVIPHGVDPIEGREITRRTSASSKGKTILYFGVISPRKGLENLIAAYSLLANKKDDCDLLLAGATPPYYEEYPSKLRIISHELKLDSRIHFLGHVDDPTAHKLFSAATFIVLPYSYDMSASGALSWALGHGVATVTTDTEYFVEELSQGGFGLVVRRGDPKVLADAMESMLDGGEMVRVFSYNSRRLGLARSWPRIAEKTLSLYESIF